MPFFLVHPFHTCSSQNLLPFRHQKIYPHTQNQRMHIHTHSISCSTSHLTNRYIKNATPLTALASAQKPFNAEFRRKRNNFSVQGLRVVPLGFEETAPSRKVVEHICLIKAKVELSNEDEKDMLDFLYTTQYQMRGILAISLGRISHQNLESYTHAVFMRFQMREDLAKFYENPFYLGVLKDHVTPYCHELTYVDYETEVEDDILPIFRKGEEFDFGVEFILLIAFTKSSLGGAAEEALAFFEALLMEFPSLIVQATRGSNFNRSSKDYTHAMVIRFRSCEAFNIFMGSSEYKNSILPDRQFAAIRNTGMRYRKLLIHDSLGDRLSQFAIWVRDT